MTDLTEIVESKSSLGLEPDVITTYWLSYDRDNMTIKYGKGKKAIYARNIAANLAILSPNDSSVRKIARVNRYKMNIGTKLTNIEIPGILYIGIFHSIDG